MAFIQNTITDLDDLLVTIASAEGKSGTANSVDVVDVTFTSNNVITRAAGDFTGDGFAVGDFVQITQQTGSVATVSPANLIIAQIATGGIAASTLTFEGTPFFNDTTVEQDITITRVNNIEITCLENHGLKPEAVFRGTTGDFPSTNTFDDQGATFVTAGIVVGDTLTFLETEGSDNDGLEVLVTDVTETTITVAGTPFTVEGTDDQDYHIVRRQYVTITNCTNYNGRYIVRAGASDSATVFNVADTIANNNNTSQTTAGEAFGDNNKGIYFTPEIEVDARFGVQTFQLRNDGNLATLGSGVQGQALYSFFKERWKEVPGLTRFDFPMLSITNEQFEFINSWIPKDDTTRKMIRTAGWAERRAGAANPDREYSGIITLGTLGNTDQPYFVQDGATNAAIFETDFTGPVNEAVLNYLTVTNAAVNDIQYQGEITATAVTVDWATNGFAVDAGADFTGDLNNLATGDVILVAGSVTTAQDGYYRIKSRSGGTLVLEDSEGVEATGLTADQDDEITIARPAAIRSTLTDLSVFTTGNIITISNADAAFNGTSRVLNTAGFNSSTFLELDPISATWQTANDVTSASNVTILFDQRTNFKIFVRERGKTYSDADLADIGVTQMTYIVYRFPVSNATDLDINTTNDNAIVGVNLDFMLADATSVSGFSTSAIATDFTINADASTITSAAGVYRDEQLKQLADIFSAGHQITLSGYTNGTPTQQMNNSGLGLASFTVSNASTDMTENFGKTFTIASVVGNTITVSGNTLVSATPGNTADDDYEGTVEIFEEHGFYAGAPILVGGAATEPLFNAGYNVVSVPNERVFVFDLPSNIVATDEDKTEALNARLNYIGTPSTTYIDLEYFEDTYTGLEILGPWKSNYLTSPAPWITTGISVDGTVVSDSNNQLDRFVVGAYLIIVAAGTASSDVNNGSGTFPAAGSFVGTGATGHKIVSIAADGSSLTVDNAIGTAAYTTTDMDATNLYQYFAANAVVQEIDQAPAKDSKWYRVSTAGVATVSPIGDSSQGGALADDVDWKGYYGTSDQDPANGIDIDNEGAGFQVEADEKSAYTVVLDANASARGTVSTDSPTVEAPTATKEIVYEWAQWALRQSSTIDVNNLRIGKIADALVQFVGSTLETSQSVFVADIATIDVNNIRFYDYANNTHVFPLEVLVTINFNDNLDGQQDNAVFYAYYTALSTGNDFGTNNALQVNRSTPQGAQLVGSDQNNIVPANRVYQFNYAYASDSADAGDGLGAGRTGGTDQNITVVAIGLYNGQYVKASGNITENGATISLVAPLERNYVDEGL